MRRMIILVAAVVLVLLGVLVWKNLSQAMDRSRQKRTMAGMRDWAAALESLPKRHRAGAAWSGGWSSDLAVVAARQKLPVVDGWGRPYRITTKGREYRIQSAARDGKFEHPLRGGVTTSFDADIAWANGTFFQYPEGI